MADVLKVTAKSSGHPPNASSSVGKLPSLGQSGEAPNQPNDGKVNCIGLPKLGLMTDDIGVRPEKRKPAQPSSSGYANGDRANGFDPSSLLYQAQRFNACVMGMPLSSSCATTDRSSTVVKKMETSKRHGDMWGSMGHSVNNARRFIFHGDRNQWDDGKEHMDTGRFVVTGKIKLAPLTRSLPDTSRMLPPVPSPTSSMSQRERLQMEFELLEQMRGVRRRGEVLQHREPMNLQMGGSKVELQERLDVSGEIARLKSIMLPTKAKDLYVGRGFKLPPKHALNKPRGKKGSLSIPLPPPPASNKMQPAADRISTIKVPDVRINNPQAAPPAPPATREGDIIPEAEEDASHPKQMYSSPFKDFDYQDVTSEERLAILKQMFTRLEAESGGSLQFQQVKNELLTDAIDSAQANFIEHVYQMQQSNGSFGFTEFASLNFLVQCIISLSGMAKEAYRTISQSNTADAIQRYLNVFDSAPPGYVGRRTVDSIESALRSGLLQGLSEDVSLQLHLVLSQQSEEMNKMFYLSLVPYFISLET